MGILPYMTMTYCSFGNSLPAAIFMFLWLGFLFIFIGTAASDYFSPNISTLSRLLNLSPEVAGVTLVALGNTASDLIGNLVSFKASHSASLALGELLGAGLFLNCVVAGVINIMGSAQQISLRPSTALRTLTFFGAGLAMVIVIISRNLLFIWEGIYFLVCYALYVVALLMMVYKKRISGPLRRLMKSDNSSNPSITIVDMECTDSFQSASSEADERNLTKDASSVQLQVRHQRRPSLVLLHHPRSMTQPPIKTDTSLLQVQERRHLPGMATSRSPTARSLSFASATTRENISENVLNLHVTESILSNQRVNSLTSAMELWGAWNVLKSVEKSGSTHSRLLTGQISSPISQTAAAGEQNPQLSGAANLLSLPSNGHRSASRSPTSGRSRASSIFDIDHITQVPIIDETESIRPMELKRNSSIESSRNEISLFTLVDNCPICFKCEGHGLDIAVKEQVRNNRMAWYNSQRLRQLLIHHFFPLIYTWEIQGILGKFLGIINFIPVILLSLSSPVIAAFDDDEIMDIGDEVEITTPSVADQKGFVLPSIEIQGVQDIDTNERKDPSIPTVLPSSRDQSPVRRSPRQPKIPETKENASARSRPASQNTKLSSKKSCPFGVCEMITWNHMPVVFIQILLAPMFVTFAFDDFNEDFYIIPPPNDSISLKGWLLALIIGVAFSITFAVCARSGRRMIRIPKRNYALDNGPNQARFCSLADCKYCAPRKAISNWKSFFCAIVKVKFWTLLEFTPLISLLGFGIGVLWMYLISSEIVAVLQALGILLNLSDGILGVTVFAFGNSVGDLATNSMLARMGYYSMGISASWGAPMINLLITMGVALTFFLPTDGMAETFSPVIICSTVALLLVVACNFLIFGLHFKFQLNRQYGLFLIGSWVAVMIANVILESQFS